MKSTRRTTGLLVLFAAGMMIVTVATAQEAAIKTENSEPASGTRWADCLLRIAGQSNVISFSDNIVHRFIYGDTTRYRVIKEVLGTIPQAADADSSRFVSVRTLERRTSEPSNQISILLSLEVSLPNEVKPMAKEFLQALVADFRATVETVYRSEANRLEEQVRLTQGEIEYADRELVEIQVQLMDMSDRDSSSETLRDSITALWSQMQSLQLEKASQDAYRRALVSRIDDIRKEVERTVHNDEISSELEQIVQRRSAELKNAQQKVDAGLVPNADLAAVEDRLATARIDLARRREELGKSGSAAGLGQLTDELATLTMDWEKIRAREEQLNQQLKEMRELLDRSGNFERTMLRLEIAKQNLQEAQIAHNKARQQIRMFQMPSITVIGD